MSFFDLFRRHQDEPLKQQLRHVMQMPVFCYGTIKLGPELDQLPRARGPFGSKSNPIPVNGVGGEINYLNRLRLVNGERVFFHRIGSVDSTLSPMPLDVYEAVSTDAKVWQWLYFSPYHPRRSKHAPEGFHVHPWSEMSEFERLSAYVPQFGVNREVLNFPLGLPDAMAGDRQLAEIAPSLGPKLAGVVRGIINERNAAAWTKPVRHDLDEIVVILRFFLDQHEQWRGRTDKPSHDLFSGLLEGFADACEATGRRFDESTQERFLESVFRKMDQQRTLEFERPLVQEIAAFWKFGVLSRLEEDQALWLAIESGNSDPALN
ncbi:MAG TPA: hypothetical protein PK322_10520 [Opitutaceae bacterium]|nr:hypothetical protein [Opitutaceae bacterium]